MIVTRADGSIVNVLVDFTKKTNDLDSNDHFYLTSEEEIDAFIDGVNKQTILMPLEIRANKFLKEDENI